MAMMAGMRIAGLLQSRLDDPAGPTKTAAARALGVSRVTLDGWLHGKWVPDTDHERVTLLADFLEESESKVLALILLDRGFDLEELVNFAKGVYLGSLVSA